MPLPHPSNNIRALRSVATNQGFLLQWGRESCPFPLQVRRVQRGEDSERSSRFLKLFIAIIFVHKGRVRRHVLLHPIAPAVDTPGTYHGCSEADSSKSFGVVSLWFPCVCVCVCVFISMLEMKTDEASNYSCYE